MKIVSPFHDYYDNAGGIDPTHVWRRTIDTQQVPSNELPAWMPAPKRMMTDTIQGGQVTQLSGQGYILFCGEVMPFRKVQKGYGGPAQCFYGEALIESMKKDTAPLLFRKRAQKVADDFSSLTGRKFLDWHLRFDTPILAVVSGDDGWSPAHDKLAGEKGRQKIHHVRVLINPTLKDFDFHKVVDPYQARQRIEMFLTNELVKEEPMPDASDKSRMLKHGMDKWSFRNPNPPKRKTK